MIIGMDFGTTNSGMAVFDGQQVTVLGIDPSNTNTKVARTALYITNDQQLFIGREAVDHYFEHNLGRPVQMTRVWVGEIEMTVSDMSWIQDVYVWIDALSPGRLFLSIKTSLADTDYSGTVIDPYFYSLEDLIALYLYITRQRAEQLLDQALTQVVLGRPVKFSNDPHKDALAQQRLIDAALRAGYEDIYFQYEPIAAALYYERSLEREENVLIFDFGGGTLDITIMRLGNPKTRAVLATGGVPIAGDVFDRKLIRGKLPKHFGADTVYGPLDKPLTVPGWIHNTFSNWQTILQLQTPKNVQLLQSIARTARDPKGINALISLVSSNYSLHMFDTVERAKRRLSRREATMIPLSGPGFNVRESATRAEFEALINHEFRLIEKNVDETLQASGLQADEIDAVIRTGGSSQIPLFETMLQQKFGAEKVRSSNVFSSVTSGLGITAYEIEQGLLTSQVYRQASIKQTPSKASRPNVVSVNVELLKQQLALNGRDSVEDDVSPPTTLAILTEKGTSLMAPLPELDVADSALALSPTITPTSVVPHTVQLTQPETLLLWVTSHYRFLLMTARQIETMHAGGLTMAEVQRFEAREVLCTLSAWEQIKARNMLVVVTNHGIARRFQMQTLRSRIESPTPLKLDRPLSGYPIAVLGVAADEELVIVTEGGRATRVRPDHISVQGSQVVSRHKGDLAIRAVTAKVDDHLLLMTQDGYTKRIQVSALPPSAPKAKAVSLIARRPLRTVAIEQPGHQLWATTSHHLAPLNLKGIPVEDTKSKKTYSALKLDTNEMVRDLLSWPVDANEDTEQEAVAIKATSD